MSGWWDIKTAPKDGTPILLWWDGDFAPIARWEGGEWKFHMAQSWPPETTAFVFKLLLGYEPTHWQPRPELPS